MLKKTMTYTDYNGESVTEDFYFALNKAELIEMEMKAGEGGVSAMLGKILAEDDREEILNQFRQLILMSIGRRSEDGRRFIKNQEIQDEFTQTPAFGDLLVEFYTQADAAAKFVTAIVPSDMAETVEKAVAEAEAAEKSEVTPPQKTWEDFTRQQLLEMPDEEFKGLTKDMKPFNMPQPLLAVAMQRKQENPT
jgi:hypothetical protein